MIREDKEPKKQEESSREAAKRKLDEAREGFDHLYPKLDNAKPIQVSMTADQWMNTQLALNY